MEKVQQVHKRTETDNDGRTVIHWFQASKPELAIILQKISVNIQFPAPNDCTRE